MELPRTPLSCPIATDIGQESDKPITRLDELEGAAQRLLDHPGPDETSATFAELHEATRRRYGRLREHEPLQADMWEARAVNATGFAALYRVMDRTFVQRMAKHIQQESLLVDAPPVEDTAHLLDPPRSDTARGRALATFRNVGAAWLLDSRRMVLKDITTDPDHPYRPLLRKLRLTQLASHYACEAWSDELELRGKSRLGRRPSKRISSATRTVVGMENMRLAAEVSIASGVSHRSGADISSPDANVMTAAMVSDIARLDGFASISISGIELAFPADKASGEYRSRLLEAYASAKTEADVMSACLPCINTDGKIQSRLRLEEGPRSRSATGLCTANFKLRDAGRDDQTLTNNYFEAVGADRSRVIREDGAYGGVSVLLGFAAHVAKGTIYAEWPL